MHINYNSFPLIYSSPSSVSFSAKEAVSIFLWMLLLVIRILNLNSTVSIFWYLIIRKDLCGHSRVHCTTVLLKLLVPVLSRAAKSFPSLSSTSRAKNEHFPALATSPALKKKHRNYKFLQTA